MVNFTRDDVYYLFSDALGVGGPRKYVRLRDAVRRDAEKTGNYENYKRFVTYTNDAITIYLRAYEYLGSPSTVCPIWKNEEEFQAVFKDLQNRLLNEWTAD